MTDIKHEIKLVNGHHGDSAVYCFFPSNGRVLLFDLGSIEQLSNKEILKIENIYISHTHIDHFIGFDRLLRVNIPQNRTINLCGPKGFIKNVKAKLDAYTWNLLEPGQLNFIVREVDTDGNVVTASLSNDNNFEPIVKESTAPQKTPVALVEIFPDDSFIEAISLDHRTESIAYRYQTPTRYKVNGEKLTAEEFKPGPWIQELQKATKDGKKGEIEIEGKMWSITQLSNMLLRELPPFSIAYLTDIVFSQENLTRIEALMKGSDILICETCFSTDDRDRALAKKHLTTKQAALIASLLEVNKLIVLHLSNIYIERTDEILGEADLKFNSYKKLSQAELKREIENEKDLISAIN